MTLDVPSPAGRREKALLIVAAGTTSDQTGGGQRSQHIFRALQRRFDVTVLVIGEFANEGNRDDFAGAAAFHYHCPRAAIVAKAHRPPWSYRQTRWGKLSRALFYESVYFRPSRPMLAELQAMNPQDFDLVVCRYLPPAAQAGVMDAGLTAPIIIDIDDRDDRVITSRLSGAEPLDPLERQMLRLRLVKVKKAMRRLLPRAQHLWVVSDDDLAGIDHPSVSIVPNIPIRQAAHPESTRAAPPTVLFVGTVFRPNIVGLEGFLEQAWPHILASCPDAQLRVVGSGPWQKALPVLATARNVTLLGRVDDIEAEYRRAAIAIAPVFDGAGTKIKVLEALALGRAVVAASHAVYGFTDDVKRACWVADDLHGMAEGCIALLSDPDERDRRAREGFRAVTATYSREAVETEVLRTVDRVLERAQRKRDGEAAAAPSA